MAPGSPIIFKNEITDPFKSNEDQSLQSSSREFIINFIKEILKHFSNGMEKSDCVSYAQILSFSAFFQNKRDLKC